jgi:hypothetical protein
MIQIHTPVIAGLTRNLLPMVKRLFIIIMGLRVKPAMTIIAFILTFMACTESFDIKTDNSEPVIVIYGELTDELKNQTVMISRSSPYFDDEPNLGISGAKVTIQSSNAELFTLTEDDSIKGLYHSQIQFKAQAGVDYSLSVETDFDYDGVPDKYEASTTILPAIIPDSLTLDTVEVFGHINYLLYIHAQDPPGENYYLFHVIYNDSLLTANLSDYETSDNSFFEGQYIKGQLYRFSDISNYENDSKERREHSIYLLPDDNVEVKMSVISKEYFDFINQCQQERSGENPMFGGPSSNIVTNISNGGVGYFTGYSISSKSIVPK